MNELNLKKYYFNGHTNLCVETVEVKINKITTDTHTQKNFRFMIFQHTNVMHNKYHLLNSVALNNSSHTMTANISQ